MIKVWIRLRESSKRWYGILEFLFYLGLKELEEGVDIGIQREQFVGEGWYGIGSENIKFIFF